MLGLANLEYLAPRFYFPHHTKRFPIKLMIMDLRGNAGLWQGMLKGVFMNKVMVFMWSKQNRTSSLDVINKTYKEFLS